MVPSTGALIPYGKSTNNVGTEHLDKGFGLRFSKEVAWAETPKLRLYFPSPRPKGWPLFELNLHLADC
jgi:hypothetical protein